MERSGGVEDLWTRVRRARGILEAGEAGANFRPNCLLSENHLQWGEGGSREPSEKCTVVIQAR